MPLASPPPLFLTRTFLRTPLICMQNVYLLLNPSRTPAPAHELIFHSQRSGTVLHYAWMSKTEKRTLL